MKRPTLLQRLLAAANVSLLGPLGLLGLLALSAVKGTPQPVLDKLQAAMNKVMASPEIKLRLESTGFVVPTPGAKVYTDFVKSEIERWSKVIKTAGIKAE